MNQCLLRPLTSALALALLLIACGDTQQTVVVTPPTPQAVVVTLPPTAMWPALIATPPSATPQVTALADPTAAPPTPTTTSVPHTPTAAPTMTAIAAATATSVRRPTPRPAAASAEAAQAARYVFPVRSDGEISYGRYHHDYPAADIFCPVGSTFVAVIDGVVDYVSFQDTWDPAVDDGATRGGLSVAIIGDDGVRYYGSHLSKIADGVEPGVRVAAGQLLGLTGKSGDARFTDAHLHFGISHPTTPGDWEVRRGEIPPYDYLRAWQRGEDVTPALTHK